MCGNKVIKNASWIIACKIAQSVISLVIGMITARYLGPSNYGTINYASSIVAFVVPIMNLGISNILVQEFVNHKDEEGKILGTSMVMCCSSALFCIVGVVSFACIANAGETETIVVCALYSVMLVFQAVEITVYWFQATYNAKYSSIATLAAFLIVAVYKVILLVNGKSVYWFAITGALDYLLMAVILMVMYKKLGGQKLSFSKETAKKLFSKGRYYIVSSMMVTIFAQTDKIMLKIMMNSAETGFYSAATTCAGLTGFIFVAIVDSFRPSIFESQKTDKNLFEFNVQRLYSVVIYLSLAQSVVMTLFAPLIVNILYGGAYVSTISSLRIIVWYTTFSYLGVVRNIWLLAENKQKYLWMINSSGAFLNVLLNWLLIPHFGGNGAAFASLVTQIFSNVIMGYIIKPIRYNNYLMIKGANPKLFIDLLITVKRKLTGVKTNE